MASSSSAGHLKNKYGRGGAAAAAKPRSSVQDLLALGNDPFNMEPMKNDMKDFNSRGRKAPPRPPPPKSKTWSNYKSLSLILGKDASKRSKCAATAVVKPLPAAPVATATLIDFESPSSSPTFSKLSGDLSSISSTDSGFNYHSKSSSLFESGFDDDFDPLSSGSNRTTPGGGDPWSDPFSPLPPSQLPSRPVKLDLGTESESKVRQGHAFSMPTIIGPVKLSKPKRPPLPGSNILRKNQLNQDYGYSRRDSSPPMPSAPAPPPPPDAINILLNGPQVPPRPSQVSHSLDTATPHCIAEFDYRGVESDDLSFKEGDIITLVERLNEDWLRGRLYGREGIFPENYVRIVVPLGSWPSPPSATPLSMTVVALFPFIAQTWDDLDLNEGDEIKVTCRIDENWLYGECEGRTGQFPQNFVQDITDLVCGS